MPDAAQSELRREGVGGGAGRSGSEEKGLTDGERHTDKEKQRLALSQIYLTSLRLALEPHQTPIIIPCQLARKRVAFREGRRGRVSGCAACSSVNYQHNEKAIPSSCERARMLC